MDEQLKVLEEATKNMTPDEKREFQSNYLEYVLNLAQEIKGGLRGGGKENDQQMHQHQRKGQPLA